MTKDREGGKEGKKKTCLKKKGGERTPARSQLLDCHPIGYDYFFPLPFDDREGRGKRQEKKKEKKEKNGSTPSSAGDPIVILRQSALLRSGNRRKGGGKVEKEGRGPRRSSALSSSYVFHFREIEKGGERKGGARERKRGGEETVETTEFHVSILDFLLEIAALAYRAERIFSSGGGGGRGFEEKGRGDEKCGCVAASGIHPAICSLFSMLSPPSRSFRPREKGKEGGRGLSKKKKKKGRGGRNASEDARFRDGLMLVLLRVLQVAWRP